MRKDIKNIIQIPEDVTCHIENDKIKLSKSGYDIVIGLEYPAKKEGNSVVFECKGSTKNQKKLINSTVAHIKNAIKGFEKKYVYKLQVVFVHFPVTVTLNKNELIIKNFLGEVRERKAKILEGVEVKVEKEMITVTCANKEKAGQTAANMEKATRIRNRDRRVFQDGIFLTERNGVKL